MQHQVDLARLATRSRVGWILETQRPLLRLLNSDSTTRATAVITDLVVRWPRVVVVGMQQIHTQ